MKMNETDYRNLYAELEQLEERGVDMTIEGYKASPLQIVTAFMTKEEGTYMRDYILSKEGNIEALMFTNINSHGQADITP